MLFLKLQNGGGNGGLGALRGNFSEGLKMMYRLSYSIVFL